MTLKFTQRASRAPILVYAIWKLPAIQQTFEFRYKRCYSFPSNMDYFFEQARECLMESYVPTEEDVWRLRVRTTGVVAYEYNVLINGKQQAFQARDVGGERNERLKWIHSFDAVSCVLFVCALDQFCASMFEDEKQIGLWENIRLFDELLNGKYLKGSQFVLLLNKVDLFREALKVTPLTFCFGDEYKGRNYGDVYDLSWTLVLLQRFIDYVSGVADNDDENVIPNDVLSIIAQYFDMDECWLNLCVTDGIEFITRIYLSLNKDANRNVLLQPVCAIDPDQIEQVMKEVYKMPMLGIPANTT